MEDVVTLTAGAFKRDADFILTLTRYPRRAYVPTSAPRPDSDFAPIVALSLAADHNDPSLFAART